MIVDQSFIHWPYSENGSRRWQFVGNIVYTVCYLASKVFIKRLNEMKVVNKEILERAILDRRRNVPLITISNHTSCMDDPLMFGDIPFRLVPLLKGDTRTTRWLLGARELCFTKLWHSVFFSWTGVVPTVRGYGVYQKSVNFCLNKLRDGGWVHIFPEGGVNLNPLQETLRLKWGVGRLVSECLPSPLVVPIWHVGMEEILPNRPPYIPKPFKKVTMLVGNPLGELDLDRHRIDD